MLFNHLSRSRSVKFLIGLTLYCCATVTTRAQTVIVYDGGSRFVCGFARLEKGNSHFYIDSLGHYAFDDVLDADSNYGSGMFDEEGNSDTDADTTMLPKNYVLVSKKGKLGALSSRGKWLLQPVYDSIDTRFRDAWKLSRDGKKSFFSVKGLLLPFRFADVNYLDGNYFDVKKEGKWGVYSSKDDRVVIPFEYESFDYCGGCQQKGDYVFAKKHGKWGIVSFTNEILIPFEYEHAHINMRSDEWVQSFSKNGKPVVINLKTKQVDACNCDEPDGGNEKEDMPQGFIRQRKNDKWGMLNAAGKLVLDYAYDFIRYDADSADGYYLPAPFVGLNQNNRFGVADTSGNIIIPPVYNDWFGYDAGMKVFTSTKNGKDVVLDITGRPMLTEYDTLSKMKLGDAYGSENISVIEITKNGLHGFYNPVTHTLVPPIYTDRYAVGYEGHPYWLEVTLHDKKGLLNENGEVVLPVAYDVISDYFSYNKKLLMLEKDGLKGLFNLEQKKMVIDPQYEYIGELGQNRGVLSVQKGNDYGVITTDGKMVCPLQYKSITDIDSGYFLLTQNSSGLKTTYFVLNAHNGQVTPLQCDSAVYANEPALLVTTTNGYQQLYNAVTGSFVQGGYAQDALPSMILPFYHHLSLAVKNGKAGFINPEGKVMVPFQYSDGFSFYKGYTVVINQQDNAGNYRYGFIDSTGKTIIAPQYDFVLQSDYDDYFDGNFLVLKKLGEDDAHYLQGYATLQGQVLIAPAYDKIMPQKNGAHFLVQRNGKFGVLDGAGNTVVPVMYDDITLDESLLFSKDARFGFPLLCEKNNRWEYRPSNGRQLPLTVKRVVPFYKQGSLF